MRVPPFTNPTAMLHLQVACLLAWADGKIDRRERQAIEEAAFAFDLTRSEQEQVSAWLENRPRMFQLDRVEAARRPALLLLARLVSELDAEVQPEERALLEKLEAAWRPTAGETGALASSAPAPRELDPMQFLRFACTFAWVDGRMDRRERDLILALGEKYGLSPEQMDELTEWLETRPPPPIAPERVPPRERAAILRLLDVVARADEVQSREELDLRQTLRRAWEA